MHALSLWVLRGAWLGSVTKALLSLPDKRRRSFAPWAGSRSSCPKFFSLMRSTASVSGCCSTLPHQRPCCLYPSPVVARRSGISSDVERVWVYMKKFYSLAPVVPPAYAERFVPLQGHYPHGIAPARHPRPRTPPLLRSESERQARRLFCPPSIGDGE